MPKITLREGSCLTNLVRRTVVAVQGGEVRQISKFHRHTAAANSLQRQLLLVLGRHLKKEQAVVQRRCAARLFDFCASHRCQVAQAAVAWLAEPAPAAEAEPLKALHS